MAVKINHLVRLLNAIRTQGAVKTMSILAGQRSVVEVEYENEGRTLTQKEFELALNPKSGFYGELESGSLDEARAYACGLKTIINSLYIPTIKVDAKAIKKFHSLIDYIVSLENEHIMKNYCVNGHGWKRVFSHAPVPEIHLAIVAMLLTLPKTVSQADKINWMVPHFDAILDEEGIKAFQEIAAIQTSLDIAEYQAAQAAAVKAEIQKVDSVEDVVDELSFNWKNTLVESGVVETKKDKKEKKMKKDKKKKKKSKSVASVGSSNFTTAEKVVLGVGGAAILAGVAYGAYKLYDSITDGSTSVTSHNDFADSWTL